MKENFKEIAEYITDNAEAEVLSVSEGDINTHLFAIPKNKGIHDLSGYLDKEREHPKRRRGIATLQNLESFIAHANRFKDSDSVLFANNAGAESALTAILNYHKAGADGTPAFNDHRGYYPVGRYLSEEYKSWKAGQSRTFNQTELAEFLEDNIGDVVPPVDGDTEHDDTVSKLADLLGSTFAGPSTLIALSKNLSINESSAVKQSVNISSGEVRIMFANEHTDDAGQPVKIPNMFLLNISVFKGGDVRLIPVKLRYRIKGGSISFSFQLYKIDKVFEEAFLNVCDLAAAGTVLPVFHGVSE